MQPNVCGNDKILRNLCHCGVELGKSKKLKANKTWEVSTTILQNDYHRHDENHLITC